MKKLSGIGASGGVSIGRIHIFENTVVRVSYQTAMDPHFEWTRFEAAREEAICMLGCLFDRADLLVGAEESIIFKIHQMFLQDQDFVCGIQSLIFERGTTAEYAVQQTGERLEQQFSHLDDAYLQARGADMIDISNHILRILGGGKREDLIGLSGPLVLVAKEFFPSDIIQMDATKVSAFVTGSGSVDSHSMILARGLGIPVVVGLKDQLSLLKEGDLVLVDGDEGTVLCDPAPELLTERHLECVGVAQ